MAGVILVLFGYTLGRESIQPHRATYARQGFRGYRHWLGTAPP